MIVDVVVAKKYTLGLMWLLDGIVKTRSVALCLPRASEANGVPSLPRYGHWHCGHHAAATASGLPSSGEHEGHLQSRLFVLTTFVVVHAGAQPSMRCSQ